MNSRAVEPIYLEIRHKVIEAARRDFRRAGIDEAQLETLSELWWRNLQDYKVMDDDNLGSTDRNGQLRGSQGAPRPFAVGSTPAVQGRRKRDTISAETKRQIEDIVMLCADAMVTDELTQLLTQHTQQNGRAEQPLGSIRILQNNQWNGVGFTGVMDGARLRKLADQLVAYLHRSTQVIETQLQRPSTNATLSSRSAPSTAVAVATTTVAASNSAATGTHATVSLPQVDGASGNTIYDEGTSRGAPRPRYADYSDEEDVTDPANAIVSTADSDTSAAVKEAELNSDDDDTEDGGDDDFEPSVVLCQFKPNQVRRSGVGARTKWTCDLQNGVQPYHHAIVAAGGTYSGPNCDGNFC